MAVLKDLIVHGPSRFINGAKFNTINAESIGASEGIFNKLVATTLDAREATIDNLTTTNAKVVGMLDVEGELHTNAWTNANIANIGGSFYISPTVEAVTGTISITRTETNGVVSWTVIASGKFATDFIKSGTSTTGVTWTANSLVLITGNITLNNLEYPLGTLKGTLSNPVTASAASTSKNITITGVVDAQNNTTVLQELYELNGNSNISGAIFSNGKISLYKLGSYPIGIQLSSMGVDSNSIIEIYGGVKSTPTVRIGHLAGLPAINGNPPTGWGIYTDNGYFSGVIVSNSGKIGNFTIANDLHSGTTGIGKDTNVYVSPGTSSSIAIANSPVNLTWAFTAGNKFGVTTAGELYATGANISGTINATDGQIADTILNSNEVILQINQNVGMKITQCSEDDGYDFLSNISMVADRIHLSADNITFGPQSAQRNVGNELTKLTNVIEINTNAETPYLRIGQKGDNQFYIKLTNTELGFYQGAYRVAYINNNQLYITQSVVLQQMDLGMPYGFVNPITGEVGKGQWSWKVHPNGESPSRNNLNLKWIG